ncbi:MAG: hypothetical protein SW833_02635 [Cyanobacteriota bacterium]|nr:hypothetical protein [Cyanobacteriota bacterium]
MPLSLFNWVAPKLDCGHSTTLLLKRDKVNDTIVFSDRTLIG